MHEKDQFSSKESVSNDSLECVSDNGGDSLDSSAQSEDSLQILDDSLEDITESNGMENNLINILDKDLEKVIAEATKLQSQVLESIIGNKKPINEMEVEVEGGLIKNEFLNKTSEMMTDAEKQIRIHQSEKETFSKGIASIIYNSEEIVNNDENNQTDTECIDEKNSSIEEIIEKSETKEVNSNSMVIENENVAHVLENNKKGLSSSMSHQEQLYQQNVCQAEIKERRRSESPGKKVMNGLSKKGARFTVIGGQKVDLNSDKPQYLKLTLEQIQQLAMQQRSEKLKIDEEAEHYCAVHSPPRRRKALQTKVNNGLKSLNTLKQIEKNVEEGSKRTNKNNTMTLKSSKNIQRSASMRVTSKSSILSSSSSSTSSTDKKQVNELSSKEIDKHNGINGKNILPKPDLIGDLGKEPMTSSKKIARSASMKVGTKASFKGEKMTNGVHHATKMESTKATSQNLAKKVTFSTNKEEDREVHDVSTTSASKVHSNVSIAAAKTSNSIKNGSPTLAKRSSSLPRWSIERSVSPLHRPAEMLSASKIPSKLPCTPPRARKVWTKPSSTSDKQEDIDVGESEESVSDQKSDKLTGCKSPSTPPCKLITGDITSSDQDQKTEMKVNSSVSASQTEVVSVQRDNSQSQAQKGLKTITTSNNVVKANKKIKRANTSQLTFAKEEKMNLAANGADERTRAKSENREIKKTSESSREVRSSSMSKTMPCNNETRTTMVVRLHPGHYQKISTNIENKVESDVSCVKWTGDVLHRNQTKPICGLEISFLSVPQDIDIKLIPDIHG